VVTINVKILKITGPKIQKKKMFRLVNYPKKNLALLCRDSKNLVGFRSVNLSRSFELSS
jgi:hypothetical protein